MKKYIFKSIILTLALSIILYNTPAYGYIGSNEMSVDWDSLFRNANTKNDYNKKKKQTKGFFKWFRSNKSKNPKDTNEEPWLEKYKEAQREKKIGKSFREVEDVEHLPSVDRSTKPSIYKIKKPNNTNGKLWLWRHEEIKEIRKKEHAIRKKQEKTKRAFALFHSKKQDFTADVKDGGLADEVIKYIILPFLKIEERISIKKVNKKLSQLVKEIEINETDIIDTNNTNNQGLIRVDKNKTFEFIEDANMPDININYAFSKKSNNVVTNLIKKFTKCLPKIKKNVKKNIITKTTKPYIDINTDKINKLVKINIEKAKQLVKDLEIKTESNKNIELVLNFESNPKDTFQLYKSFYSGDTYKFNPIFKINNLKKIYNVNKKNLSKIKEILFELIKQSIQSKLLKNLNLEREKIEIEELEGETIEQLEKEMIQAIETKIRRELKALSKVIFLEKELAIPNKLISLRKYEPYIKPSPIKRSCY